MQGGFAPCDADGVHKPFAFAKIIEDLLLGDLRRLSGHQTGVVAKRAKKIASFGENGAGDIAVVIHHRKFFHSANDHFCLLWALNKKGRTRPSLVDFYFNASMYVAAAMAATEPSAHAVVTWRMRLLRQSPATNSPGVLVIVSSPATT